MRGALTLGPVLVVVASLCLAHTTAAPVVDAVFWCDAAQSVPYFRVNDGVCDCENGRDELATGACKSEGTRFACTHETLPNTHAARLIFRHRFHDGVCDCCDGSDEPGMACPITCNPQQEMPRAAEGNGANRTPAASRGLEQDVGYYSPLGNAPQDMASQMFNSQPLTASGSNVLGLQFPPTAQTTNADADDDAERADADAEGGMRIEGDVPSVGNTVFSTGPESDRPGVASFPSGYYTEPDIHGDVVVFICDDQLWRVSAEGGIATQLTNSPGQIQRPRISPDGKTVAFSSSQEGGWEVYTMSIEGGPVHRVTYVSHAIVIDWTPEGDSIAYHSIRSTFHYWTAGEVWVVGATGGASKSLGLGWSDYVQFDPASSSKDGQKVVGRFTDDIAQWKRYRGGQKGVLFVNGPSGANSSATHHFDFMLDMDGTIGLYAWIGDRVYFTADFHCHNNYYISDNDNDNGNEANGDNANAGSNGGKVSEGSEGDEGDEGEDDGNEEARAEDAPGVDESGEGAGGDEGSNEDGDGSEGGDGDVQDEGQDEDQQETEKDEDQQETEKDGGVDLEEAGPYGTAAACASEIYSVPVNVPGGVKERIEQMQRHTRWGDFSDEEYNYYIRTPQSDGRRLVFNKGADVFVMDVADSRVRKIAIELRSNKRQLDPYHTELFAHLQSYALSPDGQRAVYVARGRVFTQPVLVDGAAVQLGQTNGYSRYRKCEFLASGMIVCVLETLMTAADNDHIVLFNSDVLAPVTAMHEGNNPIPTGNVVVPGGIGRVVLMATAPTKDLIALVNHQHQLVLVNAVTRTLSVLDYAAGGLYDVSWSPDSQWLAYSVGDIYEVSRIRVAHVPTGESFFVTDGVLHDTSPQWDPAGRFLYFLSNRDVGPRQDVVWGGPGVFGSTRPYLVLLSQTASVPLPFNRRPTSCPPNSDLDICRTGVASINTASSHVHFDQEGHFIAPELPGFNETGRSDADGWLRIPGYMSDEIRRQFEQGERVLAFPLAAGDYYGLRALPSGIAYHRFPIDEMINDGLHGTILGFDMDSQSEYVVARDAGGLVVTADASKIAVEFAGHHSAFCVFPAGVRSEVAARGGICPPIHDQTVKIDPLTEWRQIFLEAWKYQRDNFWTRSMNGLQWQYHRDMYLALVSRLGARSQLNDLVMVMQGDLGTSHAFYRSPSFAGPSIQPRRLGCDLEWDEQHRGWMITRLFKGDTWNRQLAGPLSQPGINVEVGDVITHVNFAALTPTKDPNVALIGLAHATLTVKQFKTILQHKGVAQTPTVVTREFVEDRDVAVRLTSSDRDARYRDWVEANKRYVHERSGGQVGYIHIPDMTSDGFVETHRGIVTEGGKAALVIDLRYNSGGMISETIADLLSRRTLHYTMKPGGRPNPYPRFSTPGPKVLLINELCASDCEIFSQSFCHRVRYELDWFEGDDVSKACVRIGTRTWGGVVGIDYKGKLVDGTATSQPEYAFWFYGDFPGDNEAKHKGWGVEGWGVTPDHWVYTRPHDYANGDDPQLDAGIDYAMEQVESFSGGECNAKIRWGRQCGPAANL